MLSPLNGKENVSNLYLSSLLLTTTEVVLLPVAAVFFSVAAAAAALSCGERGKNAHGKMMAGERERGTQAHRQRHTRAHLWNRKKETMNAKKTCET